MLPTDPAAEQRAIEAEIDKAMKLTIDAELNGAIKPALSDASETYRKHRGDR